MAREDREATYDKIKTTVLDAMKRDFRPEFLNRIDEIIVFHPLTDNELKQIAGLIISDVQKQVKGQGMELQFTEAAKEVVVKEGYEPKFGARPLRRAVQRLIENPLSNQIIEGKFKSGDRIKADAKEDNIVFEKTGTLSGAKPSPPQTEEKPLDVARSKEEKPKKKRKKK
jgi:ATP-dependent Clp protease ATP-binding subunit ClpC